MPATVSAALRRFQRRLRLAAFARSAARTIFVLALGSALALLAARFAGSALLPTAGSLWLWLPLLAAALAVGAVGARRARVSNAFAAEHLERRLATGGLLLAASEGVALDRAFAERLEQRLAMVPAVLPVVRWRELLLRPIAAAGLLLLVSWLPAPPVTPAPGAATKATIERLAEDIEEVASSPDVPPELATELRAAGRQLAERAAAGETDLWREIDQLEARLDRERLLAGGQGAGGDQAAGSAGENKSVGGAPGSTASARVPTSAELAEAMQNLQGIEGREGLAGAMAQLPPELQEAVAAAMRSDGRIDAEALPADPEAHQQLSDALAKHARALAADPEALAGLANEQAGQAAGQLAEQLEAIAQQLDAASPGGDPAAGANPTGDRTAAAARQQRAGELAAELAETATEMAAMGGLDQMPEFLQKAMIEAAAKAAESALATIDPETLRSLLPEDLSELQRLAESVQGVAEQMAGQAQQPPSLPELPQLSEAQKQRLAELARGLAERLGGMAETGHGGAGGESRRQGGQERPGDAASERAGLARAPGGEQGGGHTALRMTDHPVGELGTGEVSMPLPSDPANPQAELPRQWVPVATRKAEPEVGEATTPTAGRAGADGAGAATWQLRLMPRHREVVRRFFGNQKDK